jgi:hypothetical protein
MENSPQPKNPLKEKRPSKHTVRSDLNVHKWIGLFSTSHFRGKSKRIVRHTKLGREEVIVGLQYDDRGHEVEVGVLRVDAYKVLEALIFIWESQGKCAGFVTSSRFELASILGLGWGGNQSKYLLTHLQSLGEIPIRWQKFYLTKDDFVEVKHPHPLRFIQLDLMTKQRGKTIIDWQFAFQFDPLIEKSLRNGHTKPVRLDVIGPLGDISTLVVLHVDMVMNTRLMYRIRSENLFRDLGLLAVKRYEYKGKRLEAVNAVIEEVITSPQKNGLQGTFLSHGMLINMWTEWTKDRRDYNVYFKRSGRVAGKHVAKTDGQPQLLTFYSSLPVAEQLQIESLAWKGGFDFPLLQRISEMRDEGENPLNDADVKRAYEAQKLSLIRHFYKRANTNIEGLAG